MMQNNPENSWESAFASLLNFKISAAVALAVVLFFAVSTAAVTLVAYTELSASGYEPPLGKSSGFSSRVLGVASYGYNQPVCGYNTAHCLNHALTEFSGNGWQVRIDYQLEAGVVGAIRVNGWPFMDNISGSGSGYTGYDLLPGKDYNFVLYRKVGRRLVRLTNLNLTAPRAPTPELVYCPQDAYQCSSGAWVSRSGPNCEFVCPAPPAPPAPLPQPSYGYGIPTQITEASVYGTNLPGNIRYVSAGQNFVPIYSFRVFSGNQTLDITGFDFEIKTFPGGQSVDGLVSGFIIKDSNDASVFTNLSSVLSGMRATANFNTPLRMSAGSSREFAIFADISRSLTASQLGVTLKRVYNNANISVLNETFINGVVQVSPALPPPLPPLPPPPPAPRVGQIVNNNGTLQLVDSGGVYGFPDEYTFNSWGFSYSIVVPANSAEQALPQVGLVPVRSAYCTTPLNQIKGLCPLPTPPPSPVPTPAPILPSSPSNISVAPNILNFSATAGGPAPSIQSVYINPGSTQGAWTARVSSTGISGLNLHYGNALGAIVSGAGPGDIRVSVVGPFTTGNYSSSFIITSGSQTQTVYVNLSVASASVVNTTDLELRGVRYWNQYGLFINLCVHGNKSINEIERENSNVQFFPFNYVAYDTSGYKHDRVMNAVGGIEDMKNGQCLELAMVVQSDHQAMYDATGRIDIVVDPYNYIVETNESNNRLTHQKPTAVAPPPPTPTPTPVPPPTPTPTPAPGTIVLPQGRVGQYYSYQFTSSLGTPNFWTINAGSFPSDPSLSMNWSSGYLYGTLTRAGTYQFSLNAFKGSQNETKQYSFTVVQ